MIKVSLDRYRGLIQTLCATVTRTGIFTTGEQLRLKGIKLLDTKDGVSGLVIDVNLINGIVLAFEEMQ